MHKRKAIESAQSAADLKLHLEKYHAQMKEAQQVLGGLGHLAIGFHGSNREEEIYKE